MPETKLSPDEVDFHQSLIHRFQQAHNHYEHLKSLLEEAEKEYVAVLGAHSVWYDYLTTKYQLQEDDRVTEEGCITNTNSL